MESGRPLNSNRTLGNLFLGIKKKSGRLLIKAEDEWKRKCHLVAFG